MGGDQVGKWSLILQLTYDNATIKSWDTVKHSFYLHWFTVTLRWACHEKINNWPTDSLDSQDQHQWPNEFSQFEYCHRSLQIKTATTQMISWYFPSYVHTFIFILVTNQQITYNLFSTQVREHQSEEDSQGNSTPHNDASIQGQYRDGYHVTTQQRGVQQDSNK